MLVFDGNRSSGSKAAVRNSAFASNTIETLFVTTSHLLHRYCHIKDLISGVQSGYLWSNQLGFLVRLSLEFLQSKAISVRKDEDHRSMDFID